MQHGEPPAHAGGSFRFRATLTGMSSRSGGGRQWPAWVVGLLIAAVVFAGVLFAFHFLGFGDTPGLEGSLTGVIF